MKKSEPSLLSMLDWRRLGLAFVTLLVLAGIGAILWKRAARDKDYRLHLSGHLALVSRQELGADYPDRIQLGLRLKRPEWQIDRDGSIQERGEDGKFHRTQRHAKVAFQLGVEGDYTMEVQTSLPSTPDQITFLVDAPGFPPKQKEVKLTAGPGQELQGQIEPITLHRLKKRETRASAATQETTPSLDSNSSLPKYDPEGPEPDT
ncbi:hypothetical protein JST97_16210 [bacterium]|nr:hypothetical protein [bacterium]